MEEYELDGKIYSRQGDRFLDSNYIEVDIATRNKLMKLVEGKIIGSPEPIGDPEPPTNPPDDGSDPITPNVDNYKRKPNEAIQDWVKRLFSKLYAEGFLTDYIFKLQDKEYCKQNFGIAYPLLENNDRKIKDSCGHNRYWIERLVGEYFVCSQWWKDSSSLYEEKINSWLQQILKQ